MKSKKLKIRVAKHSGFCFGVKRAYDLVCVNSKNCEKLYILGKLVHNDDVCGNIRKKGIKEIKSLRDIQEGTVIFTAHGVGPNMYEKANERGLKIIDTTCPKVVKAQRLAKTYFKKGYQIIVFGDKNHKEVRSIKEWAENEAVIAGNFDEVKELKLDPGRKYCLVSQTTQNAKEFKKSAVYLKNRLKNFIFFNTICDSTEQRQKEIRNLAKVNDVVIIVGGRDSANSKMLFEIASKINPKSHFIENAKGLKPQRLMSAKSVIIGAGASTPEWVIEKVVDKIRKIS
ncbi:MAG: 4-hydroxy-3-methylbut-2-enyl diphosphate reductase [Candidatus Moranbacteria bacterium]|nr:4-hydroxy-3-methylbut-2-enyl diphosphate reductase [Candidatus Moranbacteria bacterium]